MVTVACHQLKSNKTEADLALKSSVFIHASPEFFSALCQFIYACNLHGYTPVMVLWHHCAII